MDDELVRGRMSRLAASLRRFHLTDNFALRELLDQAELPPLDRFIAKLKPFKDEIPKGISLEAFATVIRRDVVGGDAKAETDSQLAADAERLKKLPPGDDHASEYHDLCVTILGVLFAGQLEFEKKEAHMFGGRKRIDILYRNLFSTGFFERLRSVYKIPAQRVPVECKNYEGDPGNPDFDQLSGRLNKNVGSFGILVCRSVTNSKAALDRCRSYKEKDERVIYLTDEDLLHMIDDHIKGNEPGVLETRLREVLLA